MEITKRKLKEIIKEEIEMLSLTGELRTLTESERKAFKMILSKLTSEELQDFGLEKIT